MLDSNVRTQKIEVEATIVLADGTTMNGCFFTAQGQRLTDLLNDQRAYLPFLMEDGEITFLRKTTIDRITPSVQGSVAPQKVPQWVGA